MTLRVCLVGGEIGRMEKKKKKKKKKREKSGEKIFKWVFGLKEERKIIWWGPGIFHQDPS